MVVPITLINPSRGGGGGGSGGNIVDASGTTGDIYVQVFDQSFSGGLIGIGSIVNGGANDMNVRETVTDKFGNTVSVVTLVPAGDEYLLDLQTNFDDGAGGLALPPFIDYEVEVESATPGSPTSYEVHFIDMTPGTGSGGGGSSVGRAKDFVTYQSGDLTVPAGTAPGVIAGTTYTLVLDTAGKVTFTVSGVFGGSGTTPSAQFGLRIDGTDYIFAHITEANLGGTFATGETPMGGVVGVTLASGSHTIDWIGCSQNGTPKIRASSDIYATMDVDYPSLAAGGGRTPEAATFVVSPVAGVGDYMTIEQAVAAAPVQGADIYLREGTYAPVATIALPTDRPIKIRGAGAVGIAQITIPTGAAIFSLAAGSTAEYSFSGFKGIGDSSVGQSLFSIDSAVDFYGDDVEVVDCESIVVTTTTPTVEFTDCLFAMTTADWSFWRGTAGGKLVWNYVNATRPATSSSNAISGAPEWVVTTSYVGGTGYGAYALLHVLWQGFKLDFSDVTINGANSKVDECDFTSVGISGVGASFICSDSFFTGAGSSGFQLALQGAQNAIAGCIFDGAATLGIDLAAGATDTAVSGCVFSSNYGTAALRTASTGLVASANRGLLVVEIGPADNNRFSDIVAGSTIIGPNTTVNGALRKDDTGNSTGDAYATILDHTNPKGLLGIGTVLNTDGANSLTVKETVTDAFGNTVSVETVVLAGDDYMLDPQTNFDDGGGNIAYPPFVEYKVELKSTSMGNAATYELHHMSQGAIS